MVLVTPPTPGIEAALPGPAKPVHFLEDHMIGVVLVMAAMTGPSLATDFWIASMSGLRCSGSSVRWSLIADTASGTTSGARRDHPGVAGACARQHLASRRVRHRRASFGSST
jgi:hypothetical protein